MAVIRFQEKGVESFSPDLSLNHQLFRSVLGSVASSKWDSFQQRGPEHRREFSPGCTANAHD